MTQFALRSLPLWMSQPKYYNGNQDYVLVDVYQGVEGYLKLSSVEKIMDNSKGNERLMAFKAELLVGNPKVQMATFDKTWVFQVGNGSRRMMIFDSVNPQPAYIPTDLDDSFDIKSTLYVRNAGELIWWLNTQDNFYNGRKIRNIAKPTYTPPQPPPQSQKQEEETVAHYYLMLFLKLGACALVCALLYYVIPDNPKKASNPSSGKPASSQQAKNPVVEPIPRANVVTGYDTTKPIENDSGLCEITIDNTQNNMPVYVRIWDKGRGAPVRAFYIQKGEQFTAEQFTPGTYEVRYVELYDNDIPPVGAKSEQFRLEQIETGTGTQYSRLSLTLYRVHNGNTTTTQIPADQI